MFYFWEHAAPLAVADTVTQDWTQRLVCVYTLHCWHHALLKDTFCHVWQMSGNDKGFLEIHTNSNTNIKWRDIEKKQTLSCRFLCHTVWTGGGESCRVSTFCIRRHRWRDASAAHIAYDLICESPWDYGGVTHAQRLVSTSSTAGFTTIGAWCDDNNISITDHNISIEQQENSQTNNMQCGRRFWQRVKSSIICVARNLLHCSVTPILLSS